MTAPSPIDAPKRLAMRSATLSAACSRRRPRPSPPRGRRSRGCPRRRPGRAGSPVRPFQNRPENISGVSLSRVPRPSRTHRDELLVDLVQASPARRPAASGHRRERIQHPLVLARRHQAALDADLLHHLGEAEAVHQHADSIPPPTPCRRRSRPRPRRCSTRRRRRSPRRPRTTLLLVQRLQALELVVDDARLHRAAARRVDAAPPPATLVLERGLQRGD